MKYVFIILFSFILQNLFAQKIEAYYDYAGNTTQPDVARYYSLIEHNDSVWTIKNYYFLSGTLRFKASFLDTSFKVRHGDFEYYHANGYLKSKGKYSNGKHQGLWLFYYNDGMLQDSTWYQDDKPVGTSIQWHRNGYISDSTVFKDDRSATIISWFDNGTPSFSGRYAAGYKLNGACQYFHRNGKLSALEQYDTGKLINKKYFDEEGNPLQDTTSKDRPATFPGGSAGFEKFMYKKLWYPAKYRFSTRAIEVFEITIDEEGNIANVEITDPLHPAMDKMILDMMKKSPKWIPAISHNRKVKSVVRQSVEFTQKNISIYTGPN